MERSRKFLQKYIEKDHESPNEQLKIKYSSVRLPKLKLLRSIDVSPMQKRRGFGNLPFEDIYKPKLINQSVNIARDINSLLLEIPNHRKRISEHFEPEQTKSSLSNDKTLDETQKFEDSQLDIEEKPKSKKKIVYLSIPQVVLDLEEEVEK